MIKSAIGFLHLLPKGHKQSSYLLVRISGGKNSITCELEIPNFVHLGGRILMQMLTKCFLSFFEQQL